MWCRLDILRQQNPSDVEVAITPEELEGLDEASIQALYNQRVAEERARNAREVSWSLFTICTMFIKHHGSIVIIGVWQKTEPGMHETWTKHYDSSRGTGMNVSQL